MAIIGEQFMLGDEICGAVCSIRPGVSREKKSVKEALISTGGHCFALEQDRRRRGYRQSYTRHNASRTQFATVDYRRVYAT